MTAPLSDIHAALAHIEVDTDAHRINRIGNHPEVKPWVQGNSIGRLDFSAVFGEIGTVVLGFGGMAVVYHMIVPGVYEGHTMAMPECRGEQMLGFCLASMHWLFTRTDAVEILARVPKGNVAVSALTRLLGFKKRWVADHGWVRDNDPIPATVYSLTIQEWMQQAPGLEERGHWFHVKLEEEFRKHDRQEPPHPDDPVHDRYVGAACEMIFGGQADKGCLFYWRWACLSGYAPIGIVTTEPLVIDISSAVLFVRPEEEDFWCMEVR